MSLKHLPTDALLTIIRAGANLELDIAGRTNEDLASLARTAQSSKRHLTMSNLIGRTPDSLAAIARAGGGCVTFAD